MGLTEASRELSHVPTKRGMLAAVTEIVETLRQSLASRREVLLAILFGSQARGTAREESDVDVAILAPGADLTRLEADLDHALGRDVQLVSLEATSLPLLHAIVRDGIVVYRRRPIDEARWRAHALAELDTDWPAWERMRDAFLARLAEGPV